MGNFGRGPSPTTTGVARCCICQNISFFDGVNSNDSINTDRTTSAEKKSKVNMTIYRSIKLTHFKFRKLEAADVFSWSISGEGQRNNYTDMHALPPPRKVILRVHSYEPAMTGFG
jgi:hypothetical protein